MEQSQNKLFVEYRVSPVTLVENEVAGGPLRFEAVISEVDYVNGNSRMYPRDILWPAFVDLMTNLGRHPGLVDHPGTFNPALVSDIGVLWETFWMEGNLIVGRGRIVETQRGADLAAAIRAGVEIGFSTRGYGKSREVQVDGRTIEMMESYTFDPDGSVDAVINPSVKHARIRTYTREELEKMNDEMDRLKEELATATASAEDAARRLADAEARVTALEAEKAELEATIVALEEKLAQVEAENVAARIEEKLFLLTSDHRFGAAIRAEVKKLAERGITVTLDNVGTFVDTFTVFVESAASANDDGGPRGDLRTDEDADSEDKLTPEQREELERAGLI